MRFIATIMLTVAAIAAAPAYAQTAPASAPAPAPAPAAPNIVAPADDALACATTFYIGTAIKPTPAYVQSMDDRVNFMLGLHAFQHPGVTPAAVRTEISNELNSQRARTETDATYPAKSYAWCNAWIQSMGQTVVSTGGSIADEGAARRIANDVKPDRNVEVTSGQMQIMTAAYGAWRQAGYPVPAQK